MIPFMVGAALLGTMAATPAPWAVGESYEYSAKYMFASVGGTTMTVVGIDTVRGVPSWHLLLTTHMKALVYKNDSRLESWTSVKDFVSRRFVHKVNENGKQYADDDFQIHTDSGYYRNHADTATAATPRDALDDLAFVYYLRTLDFSSFKQDSAYRIPRYFKTDHNPVIVTVLGHETLDMPDDTHRRCWVIGLLMNDSGMFSKSANAKIYFSDDGVRIPVQITSKFGPASVNLSLQKISRAP